MGNITKKIVNLQKHLYKICFDGHDLVTRIHEYNFNKFEIAHSMNHTIITDGFEKFDLFKQYCLELRESNIEKIETYLPIDLCRKYEVGFYRIEYGLNFHSDYICFSDNQLKLWEELKIIGLEFAVVFSYDSEGTFNGFGMRILNSDIVLDSFKWLFPLGQHCTFGLDTILDSSEIILVEGFRDMIAGKESGYRNIVGLGSIEITDGHLKYLPKHLKYRFCYDQDAYGFQKRKLNNSCFFVPMKFKDPYEAFCKSGRVDFRFVGN